MMDAESMVAGDAADQPFLPALEQALVSRALPGEIEDLTPEALREAAAFVAACIGRRPPGIPLVRIESLGGSVGQRRMRIGLVNDDMPFLVDSSANMLGAHGLTVHRLLHPVVCTERDDDGHLRRLELPCDELPNRESVMYLEVDRADARGRRDLLSDLHRVLADVRAAVTDWRALQARMVEDAATVGDAEGAALMRWFADGAMTLLGYHVERPGEAPAHQLGLFRIPGEETDAGGCAGAIAHFDRGGTEPLIAKADRKSSVHRRVPLDLLVVPVREGGAITGIGVYAGLWTSQALNTPPAEVPVVRRHLARLDEEFGFDPRGHAGKALRHALASLPRDLLVNLDYASVKELVTTAMSLADRPRPELRLFRSMLGGHLFAFVWLPRDELTTRRRIAIGEMIETAASGRITNWSVELGDGDLALVRFTLDMEAARALPDAHALNRRLDAMVRGWEPSVEEVLGNRVGPQRATRLSIEFLDAFPESYRTRTGAEEAAEDVLRLSRLEGTRDRDVRLCRGEQDPAELRLKTYRLKGHIPLSEAVPVFENFGFRVLQEQPTALGRGGSLGYVHDFTLELPGVAPATLLDRAALVESTIASVLEGEAENDVFNQLLIGAALDPRDILLFRAWFRYLRQTGLSYSQATVVEALRRAPRVAQGLIDLFEARHDPARRLDKDSDAAAQAAIDEGLAQVGAIDDDRILRLLRGVVSAIVRTNAFADAGREALAFKLESKLVPNLPAPVPWREIWVYSPRVEGIHLRGGPVARGGLRWSDRRDDFRTEILGLMKAQVVKNAVIVPTGAKGGFYPKQLPPMSDRDAWLAEGTESYRIFIRSLLSVTDNIVDGRIVHPDKVAIRDENDPYFVVAADKGTATFSDVANQIAVSRGFWLGDAFASGGSQGYDHKAMGITAKGAWVSVQRHFRELGVDVQTQPISVAGCGDMSGDVFGNGMLLSKSLKLVAAFDHRHIFLDPDPDPATSWVERERLFQLPRSSWTDYNPALISAGGGVFPRTQKLIPLSAEVKGLLGIAADELDPASLIAAILKAPVDLLWFGGIGTYVKAKAENNAEVGDPGNDVLRVNAADLRAKAIGEGANLAVTQAARIEFSLEGGRINTDFIDNSAGVDCSDNEVNIKIPLNREMVEGRLSFEERNAVLAAMTDAVAGIVLEDNRLQTLALSIAEQGGPAALPEQVRVIEILEDSGRLDRVVEGLAANEDLLRREQDKQGLTRPELAVLLSTSKMALQAAIEAGRLTEDPTLTPELCRAFPPLMQERFGDAIAAHQLRREIIATKIANRFVNRLGIAAAFRLTEEEGASLGQAAACFIAAERLFGMDALWRELDARDMPEQVRLALFDQAARGLLFHIADMLRVTAPGTSLEEMVETLRPGLDKLAAGLDSLLRAEARSQGSQQRARLEALGGPADLVDRIVRLHEMNGGVGIAMLGQRIGVDEVAVTQAYTKLGETLGLDWAQAAANRFEAGDQWERLLTAGLARDFEQLRLEFLDRRRGPDPIAAVDQWARQQGPRIDQFRRLVDRAKTAPVTTAPMLAQIATQARVLMGR